MFCLPSDNLTKSNTCKSSINRRMFFGAVVLHGYPNFIINMNVEPAAFCTHKYKRLSTATCFCDCKLRKLFEVSEGSKFLLFNPPEGWSSDHLKKTGESRICFTIDESSWSHLKHFPRNNLIQHDRKNKNQVFLWFWNYFLPNKNDTATQTEALLFVQLTFVSRIYYSR